MNLLCVSGSKLESHATANSERINRVSDKGWKRNEKKKKKGDERINLTKSICIITINPNIKLQTKI